MSDLPIMLRALVRERKMQCRFAVAEIIRGCPDGPERRTEAERCIREAMYDRAVGWITDEERQRIFQILDFAWEAPGGVTGSTITAGGPAPADLRSIFETILEGLA